MSKKGVFAGLLIGLLANLIGLFLASLILGKGDEVLSVIKAAQNEGFLGKLISLGAVLNLIVFFYFIKRKMDYHARGVLLATILVAILTFIIKL